MKDWTSIREKFLPEPDTSLLPPDMELPVFPRTVSGFMRQSEDPNCDLRDLARTVEIDTNLTCETIEARELGCDRSALQSPIGLAGNFFVGNPPQ